MSDRTGLDEQKLSGHFMRNAEDAYTRGWNEALKAAADYVDCGGLAKCKPKLWHGQCLERTAKACQHDEANQIRALIPQVKP